MYKTKLIGLSLILVSCMIFSGCKGSSSSSSSSKPTDPDTEFNVLPVSYFDDGYAVAYDFTGTSTAGDKLTALKSVRANAETEFEEESLIPLSGTFSITNTQSNITSSGGSTEYFSIDKNNRYRLAIVTESTTYRATSLDAFPITAKIGDSGDLGTYLGEDDTSMSSSWVLTDAKNGLANFVVTVKSYDKFSFLTSDQVTTTVIDTDGSPKKQGISIYYPEIDITINLSGKLRYETKP